MEIIVQIPDDNRFGPAMRALTPQQRSFVCAIVECGGDYSRAAAAAGYGGNSKDGTAYINTIRVAGYRLSHDEKVIAAMREEAERRLQSAALMAVEQLIAMSQDPMSKHQYKAAVALLDRLGMAPVAKQEITVKHRMNDEQLRKGIAAFAEKMGLDAKKLIGHATGEIVDAEFEEVAENKPAILRTGTEGLEDLL